MSDAQIELDTLREATRPRLNAKTMAQLRELAESYAACGGRDDRTVASGLSLLLDMHDKLEAIRRG